jgi:hypothetical protein
MRRHSTALETDRPPAVAGSFYPRPPSVLLATVESLLAAAEVRCARRPKALVVPHAGYVYSGPVAASAYAQLRAPGPPVERVILLGPAHHVAVAGLALPEAEAFLTPLGRVPLDLEAMERALRLPQVGRSAHVHALEHSLEVQLPFLQHLLPRFALVPFAVGEATPEEVGEVLDLLWGGPETLVVISTDLSHHLPYDVARSIDRRTAGQVLAFDAHGLRWEQACGRVPLQGLLVAARRRGLAVEQLDLRNSGDTAGGPDAVVGYGAWALHEAVPAGREATGPAGREAAGPGEEHARRARLITGIARAAIAARFGGPPPERPAGEAWLEAPGACFVSLHEDGMLRGCIGSLEARGTLFDEVVRCAVEAATGDPRFEPVSAGEVAGLDVEVSVLSPVEPLPAASEEEALSAIRPGVDGLVLEAGGRRAVFIPKVWEDLRDPGAFLSHLRRKAGLPDAWLPGTRLSRFTAECYQEGRP